MSYYGVIEEIWELDYVKFRVPVFKCKWADNNTVEIDDLGTTLVDLHKVAYKDEPFIMAHQAKQVFYVKDPRNERLSVVIPGRSVDMNETEESTLDSCEFIPLSTRLPTIVEENEVDDIHAIRNDHDEGLWENFVISKDN
ncbi:hypothetical protein OROMI_005091 [Orobanche minor]